VVLVYFVGYLEKKIALLIVKTTIFIVKRPQNSHFYSKKHPKTPKMALKTATNHDRRLHVALGRAQAELRQANLGILDTMGENRGFL
jgi:hypothetical protein